MSYKDVRKGLIQAEINQTLYGVFIIEIGILSYVIGVRYGREAGFATFIFLSILSSIKPIFYIIATLFSLYLGYVGYKSFGISAGILAFLIGVRIHLGALEFIDDLKS